MARILLCFMILIGLATSAAGAEPLAPGEFECRGNEPFWSLRGDHDSAILSRPGAEAVERTAYVGDSQRVDRSSPSVTIWRGASGGESAAVLVILLRKAQCVDSMSGETFDYQSLISLANEPPLTGCCHMSEIVEGTGDSSPPEALYGSFWRLQTIVGRPVPVQSEAGLRFDAEGRIAGHAGCNYLAGEAALSPDALTFGSLIITKRACPDPMMDQEQRFLAALEQTMGWRLAGGRLELLNDRGEALLTFSQQAPDGTTE